MFVSCSSSLNSQSYGSCFIPSWFTIVNKIAIPSYESLGMLVRTPLKYVGMTALPKLEKS